jgi:hypothetical protein
MARRQVAMKRAESRLAKVEATAVEPSVEQVLQQYAETGEGADFEHFGPLVSYIESLGLSNELDSRQRALLGAYARCGLLRKSCRIAGVNMKSHYNWMKNPEYSAAFEEARKVSGEVLEGLALELASGVYERPIASMGKIVGYEKIYDTKMLSMVLKARLPDKYQQRVDITSNGHSLVKLVDKDAWDSV